MAEKADAKYQFHSIVDIDFDESIQNIESFQDSIASVATAFQDMSAATKDVKLNVSKMIEQEFAKWDAGGANTEEATRELINNIETKMIKKLLTRQVKLIDENSKEVLQIPLTGTFKAAMEKNIKSAYLGMIEASDFKFRPAKISLRGEDLNAIQKKFEAQLNFAMKHKVAWDLPKEPLKLTITKDHMSTLLNNFETKLLKVIADEKFIDFAEGKDVPKLNLVGKVNDLLSHLETTFASIDSSFEIDTKQLKKLPDFQNSLSNFKENIREVVKEIITVNKQINNMKVPADTEILKSLRESLSLLQKNVISAATEFVAQVNTEISTMPMGTVELAQYASVIGKLDQVIHQHIVARIEFLSDELLASLGVSKISTGEEASIFTASLEALQVRIREAVRGAAENLSGGKYDLDVTAINEVFEQWSALMETQMTERVRVAITEVSKGFLVAQDKIYTALTLCVNEMAEAITTSAPKITKRQANVMARELRDQLVPFVGRMFAELVDAVDGERVKEGLDPLNLPALAAYALNKVEVAVAEKLNTWVPDLPDTPNIDVGVLINPIRDALKALLTKWGNVIADRVATEIVPSSNLSKNKKKGGAANTQQNFIDLFKQAQIKFERMLLKGLGDLDSLPPIDEEKIKLIIKEHLEEGIIKAIELIDFGGLKLSTANIKTVVKERLQEGVLSSISNTNFNFRLPTSNIKAAIKEKLQESLIQSIRMANIIPTPVNVGAPVSVANPVVGGVVDNSKITAAESIGQKQLTGVENVSPLVTDVNSIIYRIRAKLSDSLIEDFKKMDFSAGSQILVHNVNKIMEVIGLEIVNVIKKSLNNVTIPDIDLGLDKVVSLIGGKIETALMKSLSSIEIKDADLGRVLPTITRKIENALLRTVSSTKLKFDIGSKSINLRGSEKLRKAFIQAIDDSLISFKPTTLENKVPKIDVDLTKIQESAAKADFRSIKSAVDMFMRNYIKAVSASIIAQSADNVLAKDFTDKNKEQFSKALQPINAMMTQYIKTMAETINAADLKGMFLFKTANLLPEVVQELARKKEMSTRDFRRDFKTLEGEESLRAIMRENIAYIMKQFHESVQESTIFSLKEYKKALESVEVQPDITAVRYMEQRMVGLQQEIVRKVKKLLSEQFNYMAKEIRQMRIAPMGIGYTPSKAVMASMAAPARPASFNVPQAPSYRPAYGGGGGRFGTTSVLGQRMTPGGDTHSFMGSIVNTIRYITAGTLFMIPYNLMNQALTSTREFDYQLQKAQQNITMKNPDMKDVARVVVERKYKKGDISKGDYLDDTIREDIVEREATRLRNMTKEGVIRPLQDIALLYGLNQQEIGQAWLIATRRLENPYEALNLTKSVGKIMSYEREETDPEKVAVGLESIASQWQITGDDMDRVTNMLIKTAAMSQTTVNDVLETEKRAGAMFRDNMRGLTKDEALATSFALSSLFTQATAREGNIGGTFYKTVLDSYTRPKTLRYLEGIASTPGFERLNPYRNVEIPEGQEGKFNVVKSRELKSFTEFLTDFTDTLLKVDDATRKEMMFKVFPQRHAGSAAAIIAALDELKEAEKRLGESGEGSLSNYIKKIQDVKSEDIFNMMVNMQDTWKFKGQRAQTMWQVASFGVMNEFKDEYDVVITYLTSFLRRVRDNASLVSDVLTVLSKLAVAAGVKWLADKGTQVDLARRHEKASLALMEEGRMLNLKQAMTGERLTQVQGISSELGQRKELIGKKLATATAERDALQVEYGEAKNRHEELVARHNELRKSVSEYRRVGAELNTAKVELAHLEAYGGKSEAIAKQKSKILNLESNKIRLQPYVDEMEVVREGLHPARTASHELRGKLKAKDSQVNKLTKLDADLETRLGKLSNQYGLLNNELNETNLAMGNLQNRSQLLGTAFSEMGMKGGKFNRVLGGLNTQATAGALKIAQYDAQIKNLAQASGLSSRHLDLMRTKIDLLNKQVAAGTITTSKYVQEIRMMELEMSRLGSGVVPQGTPVSGMTGESLVGLIAAQSLLMKNATWKDKAGVFKDKAGEIIGKVRERGVLASAGAAGAWVGKQGLKGVGEVGKGLGKGASALGRGFAGGLMGVTRMLPQLALMTAAFDIFGDAIGSRMLNEYEHKQVSADKTKDMVDAIKGLENSSGLGKIVGGLMFGYDALTGGTSNVLGGTAPSFSDYGKIATASFMKDDEDLQKYLEDNFDWQTQKRDALVAQMKHDEEVMMEHPEWIRINEQIMKVGDVFSVEDAQALIAEINNSLSTVLQEIATKETTKTSELLMGGYWEDSPEVLAETLNKLIENIDAYSQAIEEINMRIEQMKEAQGDSFWYNPAGKELMKEKDKLQAQLKVAELEKFKLEYTGPVDRALRVLEHEKSMAQYQWGIKRGRLLMSGASEDSPTVKALERAAALAQNASISTTIKKLQEQLSKQKGDKQRNEILLKIAQLQYEQTENLVKIRQLMKNSMSTFNLPAGIKPLTYYEAMAGKNTHKSVTVQSGDVNVNITIGKDVDTREAEKIAAAVGKEVKKQLATQNTAISQDVKAGLGYSYLGNYGIN